MARVNIEGLVNALDHEIMTALKKTVEKECGTCEATKRQLLRRFKRELNRQCSTWERVPDPCIRS